MFSQLPKEIRLQIWKYAIPNPRETASDLGGILVIVNFELARPRVIVPAPQDSPFVLDFDGEEHDMETTISAWKSKLFNILHACHESRTAALEDYRLDLKSVIAEESIPWWDEDDVVYFPKDAEVGDTARLQWMSRKRPGRLHYLPSIHHLALEATHSVIEALGYLDMYNRNEMADIEAIVPPHQPEPEWNFAWPVNFPALESLSLMFDPGEVGRRENGSVELYAVEDVMVRNLGHLKPSQIEERAARRLVEFSQLEEPNGDPRQYDWMPEVECSVMCWKRPKARRV